MFTPFNEPMKDEPIKDCVRDCDFPDTTFADAEKYEEAVSALKIKKSEHPVHYRNHKHDDYLLKEYAQDGYNESMKDAPELNALSTWMSSPFDADMEASIQAVEAKDQADRAATVPPCFKQPPSTPPCRFHYPSSAFPVDSKAKRVLSIGSPPLPNSQSVPRVCLRSLRKGATTW